MNEFKMSVLRGRVGRFALVCALLLGAESAWSRDGVITGFYRGTEATLSDLGSSCDSSVQLRYDVLEGVTVNTSGFYTFSNTGHHYGIETQIAFYTQFDPANPQRNRAGLVGVLGDINLMANVTYTVVAQEVNCQNISVANSGWSYTYSGPGRLFGPSVFLAPTYTTGSFNGNDPLLGGTVVCGVTAYQATGPVRVPRTGDYSYSDSSIHFDLDMSLIIYEGSFDPDNPNDNIVTAFDDGGSVRLETGVDYFLVVQPLCENNTGDFFYVLLGPGEGFEITAGVNGAYLNTQTPGQGIFMEVFPDIPLMFAAWFTWDTAPAAKGTAGLGDANNRWVTAQGSFEGDTANLQVFSTTGGVFDNNAPVENQEAGTMTIRFDECGEASVDYDIVGLSGSFTMNKLANDNQLLCEKLAGEYKVPFDG